MDEEALKREIGYAGKRQAVLVPIAEHFVRTGNLRPFKKECHAFCGTHFGLEQGGDFNYGPGDCESIQADYERLYSKIFTRRLDHMLDLIEMYAPDSRERQHAYQSFLALAHECADMDVDLQSFESRLSQVASAPGKTGTDLSKALVEAYLKYFGIMADQVEIELAFLDLALGREENFVFSPESKKRVLPSLTQQMQFCLIQIKLERSENNLPQPPSNLDFN